MAEFEIPKFKYKGNLANIKEMAGGSDLNYMSSVIEKIILERNEKVDNAILGEIQKIANEEGIETKIILNKNAIADALRKQIPQKPYYEGDGYDDSGNLIYDTWICPNCGDRYEVDYETHRYCPMCGQSIDWSEGE